MNILPDNFNMDELINPFITAQDISLNSRITYFNAMQQFVRWCREKKVEKPQRETILSYKFWLDTKGLSSYTKAIYIVVIRRFFLWTEDAQLYPNVSRGVRGIKKYAKNHQKESLSIDSLKQLFASIDCSSLKGKRDFALINILVRTGLRLKEIASALIEDMYDQRGEMSLWIHGKGRSSKDEFVLLTPQTLVSLYDYLQERVVKSEKEPIFISLSDRNYGKKLTIFSLSRIIKRRLRAAGFDSKRITAHSLRHTFGVLSMQAGASLYEVQLAMRHSAPTTTQLYLGDIERIKRLEASPERKMSDLLDT
ncbi:MAG TPA: tyrosine-type recombinase/integrase [Candidatus Babeliales bacterium]|nr:tyrosine-type recombinase/integrase [Candidatus Babeliales bacterium]